MLVTYELARAFLWSGIFGLYFLIQSIFVFEVNMPRWVHTFSSHSGDGEGKAAAEKRMQDAAAALTRNGMGKTYFARAEKKAGDWQVNIYKR